ncbi:hypothetical protein Tco_0991085 [Tanacetum coccineum]|uniref:BAG domain-containing protein n=1 Tax=Tanacetum coccineum TaxID=301880 RepID=A0ABQ5EY92_9ASTR
MSSYNHPGCSCCGGPFNGGNCPSCSSVGSGYEFVYDPNPYSYNETPNFFNQPSQHQYETYSCEFCGGNSHPGFDCQTGNIPVFDQGPCYNQNFGENYFPQNSPSFSRQYICREYCGGPHETFQCQPKNQNFYNSNSSGFDQIEPPQYFINNLNQINNELCTMMETFNERIIQQRKQEAILEQELVAQREQELLKQAAQEKQVPSPYSIFHQLIEEMCGTKASAEQKQKLEEMMLELLELCREKELYCVHDSIEDLIGMAMNTMLLSINLKSQRLDKEKQEVKNIVEQATKRRTHRRIKSSVESLVPVPSESEVTSDNESECDVPVNDESSPIFTTFSNPLFDCNDDFTSSDDKSLSNEDGLRTEDFDLEEEIHLVENFSYDNSSPRLPEELNAKVADTIVESLSPPLIPIKDSNSHMEEIDLFLVSDDSMPPGIENNDYNSEGDINFLEEFLSNDPIPLPENESSNLDHFNDPSSPRPPPEPPDVEICLNFEPDTGVLTTKVVKGISEHYVLMPNILPTLPTLNPDSDFTPYHDSLGSGNKIFDPGIFIEVQSERLLSRDEFSISFIRDPLSPVFDTLLPFSSENEDKVFNPGILISPLLSHRGEITSNFSESPMMIFGGSIPLLDVSYLHFYPP